MTSYECKHECGYEPRSRECLAYQLRKLIEEASEVLLAMIETIDLEPLQREIRIQEEWADVKVMIDGIEKYHPRIKNIYELSQTFKQKMKSPKFEDRVKEEASI